MNLNQPCADPEDMEYFSNEWFMALANELINNAAEEQKRRYSETGGPRKVEATPTLLPGNKRRKGSTDSWRNQGRRCSNYCTKKLLASVIFVATRVINLYFLPSK